MTHVATQGLHDPPKVVNGSNITSWVKEYSLEYSSDGDTYNGYFYQKDLKVSQSNPRPQKLRFHLAVNLLLAQENKYCCNRFYLNGHTLLYTNCVVSRTELLLGERSCTP